MVDCQVYGLTPTGHHLTNVVLRAASTMLLLLLLRRMPGALWRSACVAALFGWHPLHVESVAWVAERKDVLSGFFFMLTLLSYARYAQTTGPRDDGQQDRGGGEDERPTSNVQRPTTNARPGAEVQSSKFKVQGSRLFAR